MARDICVAVEKYMNSNGEEKTRWIKVGVILDKNGKEFVLLDPTVSLAGLHMAQRLADRERAGDRLIASIFDRDNQGGGQSGGQGGGQGGQSGGAPYDDDLPF